MFQTTVSILITTYNRPKLLKRAVESVLAQTFKDFEIVIIDDASEEPASKTLKDISDKRISIYRNNENLGSKSGDRVHLKRFVHVLSKGKYIVYLCDDDYWIYNDLLERQVRAFTLYPGLAFVAGGQLSNMNPQTTDLSRDELITQDNVSSIFDFTKMEPKTKKYYFHRSPKNHEFSLYTTWYLPSRKFLKEFCEEPTTHAIIAGATLYSKEIFIRSNTFALDIGSKWQAGYEIIVGPAIYGDVIYINQPCIMVDVRPENASFRRTQEDHYLDSVYSTEIAFKFSLGDPVCPISKYELLNYRAKCIIELTFTYLRNSIHILKFNELGMCSKENISRVVTPQILFLHICKFGGLSLLKLKEVRIIGQYYYNWWKRKFNG